MEEGNRQEIEEIQQLIKKLDKEKLKLLKDYIYNAISISDYS